MTSHLTNRPAKPTLRLLRTPTATSRMVSRNRMSAVRAEIDGIIGSRAIVAVEIS